ncbi:TspO/MBR family protein [Pseudogemmobacter sonorensis]|uniref:TspO/MBR family protein n=1 Tax=Pseudogemmobacter sonorensis TaxID=2989681 RepID=UPI003686900B
MLFALPVVLVGWAIGGLNTPGLWYDILAKPAFNPPGWVFAPVWTVLYVMIGAVGWRIWDRSRDGGLRALWALQLALNFMWSPVFFGLENPGLGFLVIGLLLATIAGFVLRAAARGESLSAVLFLPYLAWVSFAALLNFQIWRLN